MFGKLLGKVLKSRLENEITNDTELQELLKEGDRILESQKRNVIDLMIKGYDIPSPLKRYINLNNLNQKEKDFFKIKIVEQLYYGNCPSNEIIKLSNFNETHPMWYKYEDLKDKRDRKKKNQQNKKEREEQKRIENLISKYGEENYKKTKNGELFENMDEELLIFSRGVPPKKDENLVGGKRTEICYYDEYETHLKTISHKFSIRLVDGKVKGWKNI